MLERLLLPQITGLELTDVKYEDGQFIVDAHLASTTAECPKCQHEFEVRDGPPPGGSTATPSTG